MTRRFRCFGSTQAHTRFLRRPIAPRSISWGTLKIQLARCLRYSTTPQDIKSESRSWLKINVKAILINNDPGFSEYFVDLLENVADDKFPFAQTVGKFEVRWR